MPTIRPSDASHAPLTDPSAAFKRHGELTRSRSNGFRSPLPRYDRARDLPGLLALWPEEIADDTVAGRARLIRKLRRCLRQERQRGIAGHWTYDLARHAALYRAYRHELTRHTGPTTRATALAVSPSRLDAQIIRCRDAFPDPSAWRVRIGPPHSSAPP